MKKWLHTLIAILIVAFNISHAHAVSFGSFDPRSLGMGGTGVASATSGNASYFNPAMLAITHVDDDFSLEIPVFGLRAADPEGLQDALDAFQAAQYETTLSNSITTFNASPTQANAGNVATAARNLIAGFNSLSNKALVFEANLGAVIGIPNKTVGISVMTNARVIGGADLDIQISDTSGLGVFATELEYYEANGTAPGGATYLSGSTATDLTTGLTSKVNVRGAVLHETGLTLASDFRLFGFPVAIGITPKTVEVTTFDASGGVESTAVDSDQGKTEYSDSNMDVGLATYLGGGFRLGVVAKNISKKSYATALGNIIEVKPQIRAGIAHQTDWTTIAIDVDITKNPPAGLEEETQFISAGIELDVFNFLQVRLGQIHNRIATTTTEEDITTFGLGFSPLGIHVDLAYAGNSRDKSIGLQLGFRF